ncbi:MAG: hypothetical protein K2V38_21900, partial [Gemmataceae bacterium]|nr:hypothetical protein [Gemmataceae bacterium]
MSRPNQPWYRKAKDCWYVKLDGRLRSLGVRGAGSEVQALIAFGRLQSAPPSAPSESVAPPPKPAPAIPALTVAGLLDRFLADARTRLRPKTVTRYAYDTGSFRKRCGSVPLAGLSADHVRRWLHGLRVSSGTKAIMLRSLSA